MHVDEMRFVWYKRLSQVTETDEKVHNKEPGRSNLAFFVAYTVNRSILIKYILS